MGCFVDLIQGDKSIAVRRVECDGNPSRVTFIITCYLNSRLSEQIKLLNKADVNTSQHEEES